MIANSPSTRKTTTALDIIENSPYEFFLGGSRRMYQLQLQDQAAGLLYTKDRYSNITVHQDTDYDFYATYTDVLLADLLKAGFAYTENCEAEWYTLDTEVVAIVQLDNVQVVLRRDALFYKSVFENIPRWYFYRYLWKSSPEFQVDRKDIQPTMEALFEIAIALQGGTTCRT